MSMIRSSSNAMYESSIEVPMSVNLLISLRSLSIRYTVTTVESWVEAVPLVRLMEEASKASESPRRVISSSMIVFALTVSSNVRMIAPASMSRVKFRRSGAVVSLVNAEAGMASCVVTATIFTPKLSSNVSARMDTKVFPT